MHLPVFCCFSYCYFTYANLALDKRPFNDVIAGHAGMR